MSYTRTVLFYFAALEYQTSRTDSLRGSGSRAVLSVGLIVLGALFAGPVSADASPTATVSADSESRASNASWPRNWHYGKKGLTFDPEGPTALWFGIRLQTRFDDYPGQNPSADDLRLDRESELDLNRGRLKGGGTLAADWFDVYFEYDQPRNALLDFRTTFKLNDALSLRIGQWKSDYNRERVDSSGKQQLVERSISNYWFTVDRQPGVALSGRLGRSTRLDSNWWLEYLSGQGRGGGWGSDGGLWLLRYQWNPQGEPLPFSQSDLVRRERPLTSIALAVVDGETPYSRFSSAGGGALPDVADDPHDLTQVLFETAAHWRGVSWQQEYHSKRIRDQRSGLTRRLDGGYIQIGSFLNEWWRGWPAALELAGRVSVVDPDHSMTGNTEKERSIGLNWFFNGHRNKLSVDVSWLDFRDPREDASRKRIRLQWELSL